MLHLGAGLRRQARRYFGAVAWLFGLVLRRYRTRTVAVFAASTAGVTLVAAGMAAVFAVVSVLETGGTVRLAGIEVTADLAGSLLGSSALAALAIVVGSGVVYVARRTSIDIATDLMKHLSASVLAASGPALPHPLDFRSDRHVRLALARLRGGYVRKCFLVVRRSFDLPVLLLTFLAGIAALVWLHPVAAAALMVAVAVAVPAYYLVNRAAVAQTKRFESLAASASRRTRGLASTFARRPHDPGSAVHAAYEQAAPIQERVASFTRRFLVTARSDLTSQLTGAVALFGLVAFFGTQLVAGAISITAIVAFMVVARFVLVAMRGMFNAFATVSRHYPSIHRLHRMFASLEPASGGPHRAALRLRLRRPGLREDASPRTWWRLERGQVLAVSTPVTPSRYTAWYFAALLAGSQGDEAVRAVRDGLRVAAVPPEPDEPVSLRRHFALAEHASLDAVERRTGVDVRGALHELGIADVDQELAPAAVASLAPRLQRALALAAAAEAASAADAAVVVAPSALVPDEVRRVAPEALLVLRLAGAPSRSVADAHVVAASDGSIVAWGSSTWVRDNWRAIVDRLAEVEAALQRKHGEDEADDDEEDEG